jgi:uncharacterized protein YgiM (DUF1202 family)
MTLRILGLVLSLALAAYGLLGPVTFDRIVWWEMRWNTDASPKRASLKVVADKVNVRRSASIESDILGELKKGDAVFIVDEGEAGWVKVSAVHVEGWVKRSFLSAY